MALQYKMFAIPALDPGLVEAEMNRFLRTVSVIQVSRELVKMEDAAFWAYAVEYQDGDPAGPGHEKKSGSRRRIDYKESLSPEDFALFAKLRDWRKQAAAEEAVPVYTIFTNEQLAAIAQKRIDSPSALQAIDGVGDARVKKYAAAVISIMKAEPLAPDPP